MNDKKELQERKTKLRKRKRIIAACKIICIAGISIGVCQKLDLSWLDDSPKEYTIPKNAISGGQFVGEDGVTYERFQLDGKFYILSKESGAQIPQN